ncbi:hypothetical protein [Nitratidesulfovibrio sp. 1201_IL3209]|uniref:hypothetical protein n=1 Tax=Nitratidesulfovibrio sp. 1201_IL3209 TaxID=3084053 RepID=UPI002FDA0E83
MSERIRHAPGSGSAGPSGGFGERHDPERSDRAARFRRAHRPGDTVRGTFLRPAAQSSAFAAPGASTGGLGWADIEGQTLLASMPVFPQPGTELLFRVERTEPDIVLRLLAEGDGAAVPPPSPARLAADYATARDRLDARLAKALFPAWGASTAPNPPPTAAARHAALAAHVAEDAETAALFLACQRARLALLPVLRAAHPGVTLLHLPWLCPTARALDCAVLPPQPESTGGGLTRILLGGMPVPPGPGGDPDGTPDGTPDGGASPSPHSPGRFLLHGLLRAATQETPARLAFRVMAEHPDTIGALLEPLLPILTGQPEDTPSPSVPLETALLSTGPLPAGPSDPLGLLLAALHGGSGLLA